MISRTARVTRAWASVRRTVAVVGACVVVPYVWWSAHLGPMRPGGVVTVLNYDQYQYTLPDWTYAAAMLRQGSVPLWNPYQLCGAPFFATQHHGLLYPPNWLILFLPVAEVMRILIYAHYALAMGGAYWCARVFGAGRSAALLAGVAYAFSGRLSNIGVVTYPAILVSVAWLPWQLGLTRATLVRRAHWQHTAMWLGLATAMVLFGGHPQYVLMAAQLCGAYALAHAARRAWHDGAAPATRLLSRLGLAVAVATGVGAVQLLPTAELMLHSERAPGALRDTNPFPTLLPPFELLHGLLRPTPGEFGLPAESYVGTAALALAAVPLCWRRLSYRAWFLAVAALGATAMALGNHTPLYRWYLHLPAAGLFRVPQRFIVLTTLALALLGALGADALRRSQRPVHAAASLALGVSLPFGLWLAIQWLGPARSAADAAAGASLARHALVFVAIGLLLVLPGLRGRNAWRNGLLVLMAALSSIELYRSMQLNVAIPASFPDAIRVPTAAAAYIRGRGGFERVFAPNRPDIDLAEIPPKLGMLTGTHLISDYENFVDARYGALLENLLSATPRARSPSMGDIRTSALQPRQWPLLRMLGVGYILRARNGGVAVPLPSPVYRDDEYEVFELAEPLPRAYVATQARFEPVADHVLAAVVGDPDFILNHGVILEQRESPDPGGRGSVEITRYEPQRLELRAQLSQRGLVVITDQFDPYWVATVDGQRTDIWRANYVFRAIPVDAGDHTIRLEYRPTPVYAGAGITLVSLLILMVAGVMARRSRGRSNLEERGEGRGLPPPSTSIPR